jgi:hypothetical protein
MLRYRNNLKILSPSPVAKKEKAVMTGVTTLAAGSKEATVADS